VAAGLLAEDFRSDGASVVVKKNVLAGRPCHHVEVTRSGGFQQDMFLMNHGDRSYVVLVTQSIRDRSVIEKARTGLKLLDE
jgi:hypothetical protein